MTSADYIPFVYTQSDCDILKKLYSDAVAIRVSLESFSKIYPFLPDGPKVWIDPGIDGLHIKWAHLADSYKTHIRRFAGYDKIADAQFQAHPEKPIVRGFVFEVLDSCNEQMPAWITIPQLPLVDSASRNKINKLLAESAREWKQQKSFTGKFI